MKFPISQGAAFLAGMGGFRHVSQPRPTLTVEFAVIGPRELNGSP